MNKFKMRNFRTSCFYTQIKELLKGETWKPSYGSDVLNRLLLAIERHRGNKEREKHIQVSFSAWISWLFWMPLQTYYKLMIFFKKTTYSTICTAWSLISFNVKIIYLTCSIPDVTVEGMLIYILFSWPPSPSVHHFWISFSPWGVHLFIL